MEFDIEHQANQVWNRNVRKRKKAKKWEWHSLRGPRGSSAHLSIHKVTKWGNYVFASVCPESNTSPSRYLASPFEDLVSPICYVYHQYNTNQSVKKFRKFCQNLKKWSRGDFAFVLACKMILKLHTCMTSSVLIVWTWLFLLLVPKTKEMNFNNVWKFCFHK